MKTELTRYDAARRALIEAKSVDEVKNMIDKAAAMEEYARRAKDGELIALVTELKMRAERRLGELIEEDRKAGNLSEGTRGSRVKGARVSEKPTLASRGIDKNLADRARRRQRLPEDQFEVEVEEAARLAAAVVGGDKEVVKAARAKQNKGKKERRAAREQDLAAKITALPKRKFGVILADPEWRFEPYSRETGMDRAADNHYPTSSVETIKARAVGDIAADDCVLFLWATVPILQDALAVLRAWGFFYASHFIWAKTTAGTGYWNRNKHELLLIGTRGRIPAPAPGTQWPSVIEAPVGAHSTKPEVFYELIEGYYPNLPKLELNARHARPGWDAWGNEVRGHGDASHAPTPEDDFPDIPPALRRTA